MLTALTTIAAAGCNQNKDDWVERGSVIYRAGRPRLSGRFVLKLALMSDFNDGISRTRRREFLAGLGLTFAARAAGAQRLLAGSGSATLLQVPPNLAAKYDVVIYGATVAGIGAAYTARLLGKKVLLIQHDWFGGMTGAGGLTNLDLYYPNVFSCRLAADRAAAQILTYGMGGADVNRPRAADDFAAIRARMKELRREREGGQAAEGDMRSETPRCTALELRAGRPQRWTQGCGGSDNPAQTAIRSRAALLVSA